MKVTLLEAKKEDQETIQNLGRFYVYEMSRYCGFLPGWETPQNGLFACVDLRPYFENLNHYPFIVQVNGELAGFALINKAGSTPDVDWNMGEFFIISKFQGKGIGRRVAEQIFNQFPGVWETAQIPENEAAGYFWHKVIDRYTHGKFERSIKTIPYPTPHPMVILKFIAKPKVGAIVSATDP